MHRETGDTQLPDDNHIILKICVIIVEPGSIPAQSLSGDALLCHISFSKSEAGCLQVGQMKSAGSSSPMYS